MIFVAKMNVFVLCLVFLYVHSFSECSSSSVDLGQSDSLWANLSLELKAGQVVCTKSELKFPLKQNVIALGVVGADIDPSLVSIKGEDMPLTEEQMNCLSESSEICPLPG